MSKRKLFAIAVGIFGAFTVYRGVAGFFSSPPVSSLVLGRQTLMCLSGALWLILGWQLFSGASREALFRSNTVWLSTFCAYAMLDMFIKNRDEFWVVLVVMGVLFLAMIIFFAIMHGRGYRWRRTDAKALPSAGADEL